ncbi:MAG: hypothetical protein AAFS10_27155, partial [Myxococcota bacterium]
AYELLDAVDEDTYKLLTFLGSGPVEGLAGVSNKLGISFMTWRAGNIASDEVEEVKTRGGNAKVYFKSKSGRDRAAKNSNQVEDKHVMRDMYGWCINFPSEPSLHRGYVSSSKDVLYVGYTNPIDALKTTREVDSEVIWIEKR